MRGFAAVVLFALAGNVFSNDEITAPLTGARGDPVRGRALVASRQDKPQTALLINLGAATTQLVLAQTPDELRLVRQLQLGAAGLAQGMEREWLAEVRDSLSYARSQGTLRTLDAVAVAGGGVNASVIRLLGAELEAPVTAWNPLEHVVHDGVTLERSAGPLLAVAIGLALRQLS